LRAEKRLLAVVGLSNIAVVETPDAVLVAHRDNCQDIKSLVGMLKGKQRDEADAHHRVYRPWGYYESLNKNEHYQIKHIVVKPGAKLSLQMHQHRSEHWVIIKGTATVTRGDNRFELSENESVYIPVQVKHRIENNTLNPLHIIEVQTGQYLGEDDIVRFEDIYGRKEVCA
jgi:mannose-1-phosphate guanylyltransferase/mannose-6-phosphate isomerase